MKDDYSKHNFINNALRIEVINSMLCEQIEKNLEVDSKVIQDLIDSLELHIKLTKNFKQLD